MIQVHRVAAILATVTAAACTTFGCGTPETVLSVTVTPDQSKDAPLIEKVKLTLTRGSSKITRELKTPSKTTDDPPHIPAFYERFVVEGWSGTVKIAGEGYFDDEVVEEGTAEGVAETETAVAATVVLKTPATIEAEKAAANAGGAAGCSCPCGTGGAAGDSAGNSGAGGSTQETGGSSGAGGSQTPGGSSGAGGSQASGGSSSAGGSSSGDTAGAENTGGSTN